MIEGINISGFSEMKFYNKSNNQITMLPSLKKVNIFIGENNCGKSRLMRSFLNHELFTYSNENVNNNFNDFDNYKRTLRNRIEEYKESENEALKNELKEICIKEIDDLELFYKINEIFPQILKVKAELNVNNSKEGQLIHSINHTKQILENIKPLMKKDGKTIKQENIIYIPILRGIENFECYFNKPPAFSSIKMTETEFNAFKEYKNNAKKIYINKVAGAYKIPSSKIFTAESLYDDITNKLLGDEKERTFIRDFERFIATKFYNDIEFTITPNKTKQYLGIKIGNNGDRALYDLGEGIKQLIVLFYKIYEQKDNEAIFLIEEPELNLHPGFQRKFMEIITKEFPKHQFFITTHSNHIIDLYNQQNDMSLYKFRNIDKENSKFYIERVLPKDVSILDEIGAKNSSVFMSNCTIWVEGISDKIYLSKYLDLYFKENEINQYKEDIHYSFVEYGGNNIKHWSFIDDNSIDTINASAITHNIFIICDNDDNSKQERKQKLKEVFGDRLYILNSREIENLLSKKVLEDTLKKDNKLEDLKYKRYEKTGYTEENYAKPNIKMALFIDMTFDLKKKYAGESNALKNKAEFAKKAIENMESFEDLSQEAKELTEKIVDFIKSNN